MGLTIHYKMQFSDNFAEAVKQVVALRNIAMDLPFETVSELYKFVGEDQTNYLNNDDSDQSWFLIGARRSVTTKEVVKDNCTYRSCSCFSPNKVIGFSSDPGEGCETLRIGFAVYPKAILVENERTGRKNRFSTGVKGHNWSSFCKTQYASDPECGGIPNFLKCHLLVIRMLDEAVKLGVNVEVNDESDYFIHRDLEKLVKEVGEWNEMIAAQVGVFKDEINKICPNADIEGPILKFPNFEHLEAKGHYKDNPAE